MIILEIYMRGFIQDERPSISDWRQPRRLVDISA